MIKPPTRVLLNLSTAEYEQIRVDIEGACQELQMLSADVSWFVSELPDRLVTCLEILESGVKDQ